MGHPHSSKGWAGNLRNHMGSCPSTSLHWQDPNLTSAWPTTKKLIAWSALDKRGDRVTVALQNIWLPS